MKEMNRREFLTLSGAAVVALSLAGCGGGPSAPPAAPTGKEAELLAAINRVWKKKYEEKAVVNEQLTLNQDAVDAIRPAGRIFEKFNETPHKMTTEDQGSIMTESAGLAKKLEKYGGEDSLAGVAGISEPDLKDMVTLEYKYSCEDPAVRAFVEKLLTSDPKHSPKAEFISIYCPVVKNETYMTAVVFWNKTA